jgi:nucleoside-diphosphate-sugar epimerase
LKTDHDRYVFGPKQDPTSQYSAVIPKFITAMLHGEAPVIYGDGMQSRDFTYGDVKHSLAAIEAARERLGYLPEITWSEGLRLTAGWL